LAKIPPSRAELGLAHINRLQTRDQAGPSGAPASILSLVYNYGTTTNNGNLQGVNYNGGGLSYTQSFTYDALNRLATAQENGGASWSQTNGYDRYGNRWIDLGGGSQSIYCNTSDNRITGWSYDSSGNLLNDGVNSYAYDAEGRIKTVNSATAYTYDGGGQRIRKLVGENTRFVYGIGGELVAEFDGTNGSLKKEYVYGGGTVATIEPTSLNSNGTRYSTSDNLGSPRVITNSSGSVVSRHDYMPFGEELGAPVGGRTTGMGFSVADGNRKKFTGYERDSETGLDFAQARYYSSTLGRFASPDPFGGSMITGDPQSFNRYAYVGNNPVNATDPSGLLEMKPDGGTGVSLPGANGALGRVGVGMGLDPAFGTENLSGDVFIQATTTTTQVIVQEFGGGQVVQQATVTVTETLVQYVNRQGTVLQSEPVETRATAVNSGNAPREYSKAQLNTMANIAKNIVEVSKAKGFEPAIALGIALTETRMGMRPNREGVDWKRSEINPMQLSGGLAKGGTLQSNIAGAIDVFNSKRGTSLNEKLQNYNGEAAKAAYAITAERFINQMRASVHQRTVQRNFSQRPPRFGPFPVWRP